jgi:phosphatidylethanolamine/phosphatidyl-N-methylethanolamine N-methyltransferase
MRRDELAPHESLIYGEFSHLYDLTFGRVFYDRIVRVIQDLHIPPAAKVLELGVGTGLTLDAYPTHCHVTGVDLAEDMLAKARGRVERYGWSHVKLRQADAMSLDLPDAAFDYVMAFHVVSVVPDARRMMAEMRRVCRPDGTITVINHFRSTIPWVARLQRAVDPMFRRMGWTTLELEELLASGGVDVDRVWKTSPRSLFTIIRARPKGARPVDDASMGADSRPAV